MSFDFTDLHTLVVRAHDRHGIPIGKMMRVTLQAAANSKFPLYKSDASLLDLSAMDRGWLLDLATSAEQQTEIRWWTKGSWPKLQAVLVPEPKFWEWVHTELGPPKTIVATPPNALDAPPPVEANTAVSFERRRTGPKSKKRAAIADTMKADLEAKRLTIAQLRGMGDKELVEKYGVAAGRTTCRDARKQVLAEFDGV
jgi:hypothetical protein